jgi:16S rRNA (cytosine967-C5)-methyltransferase
MLARGAPVKRARVDPAEIGGLKECVSAEGDLRTLPCHLAALDGLDGFFAARLVHD